MKAALFRPFSLRTWIYFGFASWMAGWGARDSLSGLLLRKKIDAADIANTLPSIVDAWNEIWADPVSRGLIYLAAFLIFVLVVVSIWVQSRAEFVFLESVAHDRLAIAEPWSTYSREGTSLFLWRLAFHGIVFLITCAFGFSVWTLALAGKVPYSFAEVAWIPLVAITTLFWLPVVLVAAFVFLLLRHFVTPMMYRDRIRTNEAWRRLLPLLRSQPGAFVLYALFMVALVILTGLGVLAATCVTCCIFGCLLGIPFVGTVLYLPVSYTFRALGPEFLAQFPSEPPVLSPLFAPLSAQPGPPAPPIA